MASPSKSSKSAGPRAVATNRQARRDYEIVDTNEAGIVLQGSEVKSLREAKVQLAESFARIDGHEIYLVGLHISAYSHSGQADGHLAERQRKLLLHRGEIDKIKVLQGRPGQGGARARPRASPARQAPGHRQARRRSRGSPGHVERPHRQEPGLTTPSWARIV